MTLDEAIEIVEYHNLWRRGDFEEYIYTPRQLTIALELVLIAAKEKKYGKRSTT